MEKAIPARRESRVWIVAEPGDSAEAHFDLADSLQQSGQFGKAIAEYRRALELKPDFFHAFNNLGNALQALGRAQEAIAAYNDAIRIAPRLPEAPFNLGNSLLSLQRIDESIAAYRQAITLRPDYAEAINNLGVALRIKSRYPGSVSTDDAFKAFQQALALKPDFAQAWMNLGNSLKDIAQLDRALECYRKAAELQPDARRFSGLLYALHFHPTYGPREIAQEHARWNDRFVKSLAAEVTPHANCPDPQRRLRIGYVSPDFRDHPVGRFILPLLANHDHRQFQIFCYSDVWVAGAITPALRSHADVWRDTVGLSDGQLAELIRNDGIDILVDLAMHMDGNRLLVFARKPAPVQVTYLAYCSTTGVQTIDYRFTDAQLDPDGDDSFYAEKSARLRSYWCFQPAIGDLKSEILDARSNITFGCLNNFSKVSPQLLGAWCELLRRSPDSRLILHTHEGSHRAAIFRAFTSQQVDCSRIEFVGYQPMDQYLSTYTRIDIALDTFPYAGGTTTCDALWMGVPVVTCTGNTAVSRGGASILAQIQLQELIASDPRQYVEIAVRLANDPSRLQSLRRTMRQRMRESPLMDAPSFARDVEASYRHMWRTWCQASPGGRSAQSLEELGALANALADKEQFDEAMETCRLALATRADFVTALITLGNIHQWKGQLDQAIKLFRQAESLDPQSTAADSRLYAIHFHPDYDARRIYEEHKQWNQQRAVAQTFLSATKRRFTLQPERLKIGYVSSAFRDHVQSYFTTPLFAHHDRKKFEIVCYSDVRSPDSFTERLRGHANVWRETCDLSHAQLAQLIERDEIDILVDLMLHMPGNRLPAFAHKPAPVQVTWLGYPGTTGLETMDYRLSDPFIDPGPPSKDGGLSSAEQVYSERTVLLPHCFWCYDPLSNDPPSEVLPALANGFVTFGSLNGFYKITELTLRTWARILARVPGARMAMLAPPGETRSRVLNIFQQHCVSPDRIEFGPRMSRADYLDSYRRIDLCLDPIPYPGHTTTLDALWMGVAVVTLAGATAISRGGLSILSNIGLTECISYTPEEYVNLAVALASDPLRLSSLRIDLRQRMLASPLMKPSQFARDIEAAYRQMWQASCDAASGLQ